MSLKGKVTVVTGEKPDSMIFIGILLGGSPRLLVLMENCLQAEEEASVSVSRRLRLSLVATLLF